MIRRTFCPVCGETAIPITDRTDALADPSLALAGGCEKCGASLEEIRERIPRRSGMGSSRTPGTSNARRDRYFLWNRRRWRSHCAFGPVAPGAQWSPSRIWLPRRRIPYRKYRSPLVARRGHSLHGVPEKHSEQQSPADRPPRTRGWRFGVCRARAIRSSLPSTIASRTNDGMVHQSRSFGPRSLNRDPSGRRCATVPSG